MLIPPPPLPASSESCALFLDFDGTLVELAPTPHEVQYDADLVALLGGLAAALGGALAIISGREIATLDRLLSPLGLAAAGLHGIERRRADGTLRGSGAAPAFLDALRAPLRAHVERRPGLLLEDKSRALAVHYRAAPWHAAATRALLQALPAVASGDAQVLEGECVLEIRPAGFDKGTAIEEFLAEPPFAGRRPMFVGDDLPDAAGLRAVQQRGGLAVAVGDRVSAPWRLDSPQAVRHWLAALFDTVGRR